MNESLAMPGKICHNESGFVPALFYGGRIHEIFEKSNFQRSQRRALQRDYSVRQQRRWVSRAEERRPYRQIYANQQAACQSQSTAQDTERLKTASNAQVRRKGS